MFKIKDGLGEEFLPTAQTHFSAGFDVRSTEDIVIYPGTTKAVPTGVFIDQGLLETVAEVWCTNTGKTCFPKSLELFKESHFVDLRIRSGLAFKGLMLANGAGVIDMDYPDEIKALIHNPFGHDKDAFEIKKYERVGQLIVAQHSGRFMHDMFRASNERSGGFGSTGHA
jgi:dUTP pyrophosphatase